MYDYYTERNYTDNTDYSSNYSMKRLNQNFLFRNFLIDENIESSKKSFLLQKRKKFFLVIQI